MSSGLHQRVERCLAAIPAADVAGYSRPMEADEEGTLRRLKALRAEIIDPKIAGHRGCIVNQGSQNGGPRHETSLDQHHDRCGARDSDTSFSTAHGPGPFRGNRYRPGRRSPRGSGPLLSAPQSAGWVSRSIHRGAVGRRAAVLHPASALLSPAGGVLPAVRPLCPARPRLLRAAARLLLWAAGTVTRKSGLAGEPKDPGTACPRARFLHLVPVTTMSMLRLSHLEQAGRSRHAGTALSAPYLRAISASPSSIRWRMPTMSRTRAALPHVIPHLSKQDHRRGRSSIA